MTLHPGRSTRRLAVGHLLRSSCRRRSTPLPSFRPDENAISGQLYCSIEGSKKRSANKKEGGKEIIRELKTGRVLANGKEREVGAGPEERKGDAVVVPFECLPRGCKTEYGAMSKVVSLRRARRRAHRQRAGRSSGRARRTSRRRPSRARRRRWPRRRRTRRPRAGARPRREPTRRRRRRTRRLTKRG